MKQSQGDISFLLPPTSSPEVHAGAAANSATYSITLFTSDIFNAGTTGQVTRPPPLDLPTTSLIPTRIDSLTLQGVHQTAWFAWLDASVIQMASAQSQGAWEWRGVKAGGTAAASPPSNLSTQGQPALDRGSKVAFVAELSDMERVTETQLQFRPPTFSGSRDWNVQHVEVTHEVSGTTFSFLARKSRLRRPWEKCR